MAAEEETNKNPALPKEKYDEVMNRVAVAFAKHEEIVKGWMAKSGRAAEPRKTMEELLAEDAILFRPRPPLVSGRVPYIPAKYLINGGMRNDNDLRAKFLPTKGAKNTGAKDAEGKAAGSKRVLKEQSSDEEEGRSGLGRAKKRRVTSAATQSAQTATSVDGMPIPTAADAELSMLRLAAQEFARRPLVEANEEEEAKIFEKREKRTSKRSLQEPGSPAVMLEDKRIRAFDRSPQPELTFSFKTPSSKPRPQDDEIGPTDLPEPNNTMHSHCKPGDKASGEGKHDGLKHTAAVEAAEVSEKMKKKALKQERKKQKRKERNEQQGQT